MHKILIVEDQAQIRKLLRLSLEEHDLEFTECADVATGWEAALRTRPHIVLLDIMLPGRHDGLQLCERLKADPRTRDAKVVLVTARGHRNDLHIGQRAGADDYLIKPFSVARLVAVVERLAAEVGFLN